MDSALLEEIEDSITYIADSYYACLIDDIMDKIKSLSTDQHWNVAAHLPTPGIKLHCKLEDGRIVTGVRPSYISDRKNDDLGYRSLDGEVLNVKEWSIQ